MNVPRGDSPVALREPIDARRLRAFTRLARTGSFREVADELHLTASAVSHAMRALEEEMQCSLFDRRGHRAVLTPAGERLLPFAERILGEMQQAREQIRLFVSWGHGVLRLGATASACRYFLPEVVLEFRDCFPDCEISVVSAELPKSLELIDEGRLDLALGVLAETTEGKFSSSPLFEDYLIYVVSPSHPWAARERVRPRDFAGQKLIVQERSAPAIQGMLARFARMDEPKRPGVLELGSVEAIKEMSRIGLGVGVVPFWVAERELETGMLVRARMAAPPARRRWGIVWPHGRQLSIMAETLVGLCGTVTASIMQRERQNAGGWGENDSGEAAGFEADF